MIQIQCTQKLIKEFKINTVSSSNNSKLYAWHANLFYIDDVRFVCLVNDFSRYGFIIYNVTNIKDQLPIEIRKNLIAIGASISNVDTYLEHDIKFTNATNKSIISKMNALIKFAVHQYQLGDEDIEVLNRKLAEFEIIENMYVKDYFLTQLNS